MVYGICKAGADDVIRVAGHRIGTAEIEGGVLYLYRAVAEAIAIGKNMIWN